jgi:TonB family protein
MRTEPGELRDWLVTATAACALAACLAGLVRPLPVLPEPGMADRPMPTQTTWVRLEQPTGGAGSAAPAAPQAETAPSPTLPPTLPALANPGAPAMLADLPVARAPSTVAAAGSVTPQATPAAGAASGAGDGPVRLTRGELGGSQPWPTYPAASLRRGEAGTVTVRLSVSPAGAVTEARVAGSSGWRSLDEAATDTIRRRWTFPPGASRDYLVDIRFQLL